MVTWSLTKVLKSSSGQKTAFFNKWCWLNWQLSCRRMQVDPFLSPCTKLKSKWIKEFHIKPETLKFIEKKVRRASKLLSYFLGSHLLGLLPTAGNPSPHPGSPTDWGRVVPRTVGEATGVWMGRVAGGDLDSLDIGEYQNAFARPVWEMLCHDLNSCCFSSNLSGEDFSKAKTHSEGCG